MLSNKVIIRKGMKLKEGDYRKCPIRKDPSTCKIAVACACCDYYFYGGEPPYIKKRRKRK
jgi:hypothetical protein